MHLGVTKDKDVVVTGPPDKHIGALLRHSPAGNLRCAVVETVIADQGPAFLSLVVELDESLVFTVASMETDFWVVVPLNG